jgi:hypothetical protein
MIRGPPGAGATAGPSGSCRGACARRPGRARRAGRLRRPTPPRRRSRCRPVAPGCARLRRGDPPLDRPSDARSSRAIARSPDRPSFRLADPDGRLGSAFHWRRRIAPESARAGNAETRRERPQRRRSPPEWSWHRHRRRY